MVCYLHCKEVENSIRGSKTTPSGAESLQAAPKFTYLRHTVQWLLLMPPCTTQKLVVNYFWLHSPSGFIPTHCQYLLLTNTFLPIALRSIKLSTFVMNTSAGVTCCEWDQGSWWLAETKFGNVHASHQIKSLPNYSVIEHICWCDMLWMRLVIVMTAETKFGNVLASHQTKPSPNYPAIR